MSVGDFERRSILCKFVWNMQLGKIRTQALVERVQQVTVFWRGKGVGRTNS